MDNIDSREEGASIPDTHHVILKPEDLLQLDAEQIVIIDATSGADAKARYAESHLTGARFVDLESDLSAAGEPKDGGRHPLPSAESFAAVLSRLGIAEDSHVVVYDRMHGANAAARFWWLMRALGHRKIQVLSGGFQAAVAAGFPVSNEIPKLATPTVYPVKEYRSPRSSIQEVSHLTTVSDSLIIDVREADRYAGFREPIDLMAGHIPSAVNIPFSENLDANGRFKSPERLRELYAPYFKGQSFAKAVVHCGSGVTACHTLLALASAGYPLPKLYVGSWSEWSRSGKEIATGMS